jgi:hypothetical protein
MLYYRCFQWKRIETESRELGEGDKHFNGIGSVSVLLSVLHKKARTIELTEPIKNFKN